MAFRTVWHSKLAEKLARLEITDNIGLYNWMIDYLIERKHLTIHVGILSEIAGITACVVQCPGIGQSQYDTYVSDLHPQRSRNAFVKFAFILSSVQI